MNFTPHELLKEREAFRPGSDDWDWRTRAAWRIWRSNTGHLLTDKTPPPADFGPAYLQERIAA